MNEIEIYTVIIDHICQECALAKSKGVDFYQYMTEQKLASKYADIVLDSISTVAEWKTFSYYLEQYVNTHNQYWEVVPYIKAMYEQIYNFVFVVFGDAALLNLQFARAAGAGADTTFVLPIFAEENI